MAKIQMKQWVLFFSVVSSLLLLSNCATSMRTEDTIEQRVNARWNAVLNDDFSGAYEFLSPGYRSSVSLIQYQRALALRKVKWTAARYNESSCTETVCNVKISIDYELYGALPGVSSFKGTQEAEESWLLYNGNWYFVPDK